MIKTDTDKCLLMPNSAYKRDLVRINTNPTLSVEGHCDYSLTLWYVDAKESGRCRSCNDRKMEINSYDERQCYRCGRWYSGSLVGRSQFRGEDLVNDAKEPKANVQSYHSQHFEETLGAPKFKGEHEGFEEF